MPLFYAAKKTRFNCKIHNPASASLINITKATRPRDVRQNRSTSDITKPLTPYYWLCTLARHTNNVRTGLCQTKYAYLNVNMQTLTILRERRQPLRSYSRWQDNHIYLQQVRVELRKQKRFLFWDLHEKNPIELNLSFHLSLLRYFPSYAVLCCFFKYVVAGIPPEKVVIWGGILHPEISFAVRAFAS